MRGTAALPLLRYGRDQQISTQIEAQLRRLKIDLPKRFEVESNQTMMAMIAAGSGWAVTTPTCYFRARRFHGRVQLHPFPAKGFARFLSVFATSECAETVVQTIASAMRTLVGSRLVAPAHEAMPWLTDSLYVIAADDPAPRASEF